MNKSPAGFISNREEFAQNLILLRNEGVSIRGLSRRFGVSRNTVRKILRAHEDRRETGHEAPTRKLTRASKLDVFSELIKETLTKYPKITGQRLYETLRDAGYGGGISILRDRLGRHRKKEQEPIIRFETEPGRQGQMDWSPYTIPFTRTGKATVQCFSYILGFSRRQYIDFTLRHDFYTRKFNCEVQHLGKQEGICYPKWPCQKSIFILPNQSVSSSHQCIGRAKALLRLPVYSTGIRARSLGSLAVMPPLSIAVTRPAERRGDLISGS